MTKAIKAGGITSLKEIFKVYPEELDRKRNTGMHWSEDITKENTEKHNRKNWSRHGTKFCGK